MSYESVMTRTETREQTFLTQVYAWMAFALIVTAATAWVVVSSPNLLELVYGNLLAFIIAEFAVVLGLSWGINRISAGVATLGFVVYSVLNGLTLSLIFLIYTSSSIASTFLITAGMFGSVSFYGYVTKRDLTGMRHFLFMGLIGLIIASVVNMFVASSALYWITSFAGVIIFTGLTAYDTQRIRRLNEGEFTSDSQVRKTAIIGALHLYLDFINLFLYLLRFMGRRR